jgi:hypothetical protein
MTPPRSNPTPKRRTGIALWRASQRQGFTAYLLPSGCKLFILHKPKADNRADAAKLHVVC